MSEVGAAAAQRHREHMRSKAERLGGGEDARSVDSSSFTPGEPLDADIKTGMRPVSRQARASGGAVTGAHARAIGGRAPRKSGGGFGESYANRNMKEANEDRAGIKHDMGLKGGGAAHRARGGRKTVDVKGFKSSKDFDKATREWEERMKGVETPFEAEQRGVKAPSVFSEPDEGKKHGGAAHRATGGGVYKPDIERAGASKTRELKRETASQAVEMRASGGRVARQAGGPLATPLAAGMGGQGRLGFNFAGDRSQMLADGGRAKAHERYGAGPGPAEHHPGMAAGGRAGYANGGATPGPGENVGTSDAGPLGAPGPGENKGAVGQESFHHRSPRGENSSRARTLASAKARASGGKVAEGALKQHREEHKAMGAGEHPKGCTCAKCRGGVARADGGSTKQEPMNLRGPGSFHQPGTKYSIKGWDKKTGEPRDPWINVPSRHKYKDIVDDSVASRNASETAGGREARTHWYTQEHPGSLEPEEGFGHKRGGRAKRADGGEAPAVKPRYQVYNHKTGETIGTYNNRTRAMNMVDKKDNEYGGYAHSIRAPRARGGRSGKGKTNINIIIGGGHGQQPPGPPGMNPNLAIKPPTPAPMPMPMPGGAPPAGAPMPMPVPMPMGAGAGMPPPGMPPRARGGRAPKVHGEPEAGGGSGLGRLQKAAAYGHRSREGAGMRK